MIKLYTRKELFISVKKVEYEKEGKTRTFNKIETMLHHKRYTVRMSQENAQRYGLDRLQASKSYTLKNAVYNYNNKGVYPCIWIKSIQSYEEFSYDNVEPELDEE